ncbi:hypothetical protein [Litorihabitans aurantiacus]|uniref:Uncharacterized protein n=1 Tax=Litorihabitans aurantiacus TaxID=1930061 RepID=A0AA37UN32_9MICO|nr:hypothetical protein [Litorihabitans aurantiacus]GMA31024.1 hypothetical protein GCM10025875_10160 [Litorihabitans aurantiacus]
MSKRTLFLALPIAAAMVLSACGGGAAERPSADELSSVFTEGAEELGLDGVEIPQEAADCLAEALVNSDVSDEALRAMADRDEDYDLSDEDETVLTESLQGSAMECMMPAETE